MSDIKYALETIFLHEGKFNDHDSDKGGPTNFGISLKFLKLYIGNDSELFNKFDFDKDGDVDRVDIQHLSRADAVYIYENSFWKKHQYNLIEHQPLATKILDLSINMGPKQAAKCLQRAVRAAKGVILLIDGVIGPVTLKEVNSSDPYILLAALKSEAAGFYRALVVEEPALSVFKNGWENRAYF